MSFAPDNIYEPLADGLHAMAAIRQINGGWRVVTHCMYPSNGLVEVTVRGGARTIVASDEGGAFGEALGAGIPVRDYTRSVAHIIREQGLIIKEGVIYTPPVSIAAAAPSVLLVANASQEVARWMFDHTKIKRPRDFRLVLSEFLKRRFEERLAHNEVIVGKSNKPHKFANVISLPSGRRLIIDTVMKDASSINARVVANLDVRAANDEGITQRIVYDDDEGWAPSDLNLLQVGATPVPFSSSLEVIERVASVG
jgi:hypothetical protein